MAGLFYSLQDAIAKLNKTDNQIKELIKQGKLREFRDGPNLLFKVSEVEALAADEGVPIKIEDAEKPLELAQPIEPAEAREPELPPEVEGVPEAEKVAEEEISLAPETAVPDEEGALTDADTALTSEGINVLGETDKDYQITDDTMAETIDTAEVIGAPGKTGSTPEASLEEIEEDVNLDTFGSGSGLLDLSLQADDTSLGGILDEIYTAEGAEGQEQERPAEPGSAVEMVAEAEQILPEDELVTPEPAPEVPAIAQPYAETQPDIQSNTLGMLLILPFVMLLYTAIVAIFGQRGVMPSILAAIQGVIWYIVIGTIVVAGLVVGAAFWLGGSPGTSIKKSPTPKKTKKAKAKKTPAPETTE